MSNIGDNTKKSAKQIAQDAAKKIAREPLEILKSAGSQVAGTEKTPEGPRENQASQQPPQETGKPPVSEAEINAKSKRLMEALEKELEDIKKLKDQEALQEEQQEVVEEAQKVEANKAQPLVEPITAKKKHQMPGMQGKLDKLKKKSEIRMPPSG